MFAEKIGRTKEVYVDDMLLKSKKATDHITHLDEMFHVLREYWIIRWSARSVCHLESFWGL